MQYVPNGVNPRDAQKQAYRIMRFEALFSVKPVALQALHNGQEPDCGCYAIRASIDYPGIRPGSIKPLTDFIERAVLA